jgi:hypothetical protein
VTQVHGDYKEDVGVKLERPVEVDETMAGQEVAAAEQSSASRLFCCALSRIYVLISKLVTGLSSQVLMPTVFNMLNLSSGCVLKAVTRKLTNVFRAT